MLLDDTRSRQAECVSLVTPRLCFPAQESVRPPGTLHLLGLVADWRIAIAIRCSRQEHREPRAAPGLALDRDRTVVGFDDPAGDGQAETGAAVRPRPLRL